MKYSDYFIESLAKAGYTHCFFVGGGNVMHLLESARTRMECIAVVHEVSAGIAAEYFNAANRENNNRAFALVTAGPGITNLVTAIAGSWLESRELLIVGGQARTEFMNNSEVRQVGHQQINGKSIIEPISKYSETLLKPISESEISHLCNLSKSGRKGPVFLEICLDVTAMEVSPDDLNSVTNVLGSSTAPFIGELTREQVASLEKLLAEAERPLFLVGGGLDFSFFKKNLNHLHSLGIPIATTWNAADYLDSEDPLFAGRPNTYGMRWANTVIQQSDLVIAVGARLGLQQTGFNWESFVPVGKIIRIDIDQHELDVPHPNSDLSLNIDSKEGLEAILRFAAELNIKEKFASWLEFIQFVRHELPTVEKATYQFSEYVNPFELVDELGGLLSKEDSVIPCSSGGSYTSMMQAFSQKQGQLMTNNKGLASMGYGLAGAIGTAVANRSGRTILVEGDGGFAQNLQELGTVKVRDLNLKMFIFSNLGYASIRVSQKAYFNGAYIGCDEATGVGLPDWIQLFKAFNIPAAEITSNLLGNIEALELLNQKGPAAFIVNIHPDQSYLPKVTSKIYSDGKMRSNPIHLMDPPLMAEISESVFRFLPASLKE
jgi:acetolactate synthase-1/2/3 large subunit